MLLARAINLLLIRDSKHSLAYTGVTGKFSEQAGVCGQLDNLKVHPFAIT